MEQSFLRQSRVQLNWGYTKGKKPVNYLVSHEAQFHHTTSRSNVWHQPILF